MKFTHTEIVEKITKWLVSERACRFAFKEIPGDSTIVSGESPDVIGWGAGYSVMVEVKTSRADFLADADKPFRANPALGVGNYRLYACPMDLIRLHELPAGYGLIYITPRGAVQLVSGAIKRSQLKLKRRTKFWFDPNVEAERWLMYTALSRVYYTGFLGCVNAWTSPAYTHLVDTGITAANADLVGQQFQTVPEKTNRPRKPKRPRTSR